MASERFKLDEHGWPVVIAIGLIIGYALLAAFTEFSVVIGRFLDLLLAFRVNFNLAYSLIPIYLNWIVTDYYQERRGTGFGNAVANGFTGLWVAMDWFRAGQQRFSESNDFLFFVGKIIFGVGILIFSGVIVRAAARGQKIAHYIGRIREVSYLAIMITPIVYEAVKLDLLTVLTIILFFPVFYGLAELIDFYILPPSKAELAEAEEAKAEQTPQ